MHCIHVNLIAVLTAFLTGKRVTHGFLRFFKGRLRSRKGIFFPWTIIYQNYLKLLLPFLKGENGELDFYLKKGLVGVFVNFYGGNYLLHTLKLRDKI